MSTYLTLLAGFALYRPVMWTSTRIVDAVFDRVWPVKKAPQR